MSLLSASYVTLLVWCSVLVNLVWAQDVTFFNDLLDGLDQLGLTNFTTIVRQVTDGEQIPFAVTVSDASSPKTLFVPSNVACEFQSLCLHSLEVADMLLVVNPGANFYGYDFAPDDVQFLSSLLNYHLADGNWTQDVITGLDTVIPTFMHGNFDNLENNSPQMIACGVSSNGFEIFNQRITTLVLQTFGFGHLTIHVTNAVVGMPGKFSFTVADFGANQFANLQTNAGFTQFDSQVGMTAFVPVDNAFAASQDQIENTTSVALFKNHVRICY